MLRSSACGSCGWEVLEKVGSKDGSAKHPIFLHGTGCILTIFCKKGETLHYSAQVFIVISPEMCKFSHNRPNQ